VEWPPHDTFRERNVGGLGTGQGLVSGEGDDSVERWVVARDPAKIVLDQRGGRNASLADSLNELMGRRKRDLLHQALPSYIQSVDGA
jgi:hypothetical protein